MDEISTQKNLNYIEKTITSDNKKDLPENDNKTQPSDHVIQAILNYSKSLCVLKSENKNKTKLCNIN